MYYSASSVISALTNHPELSVDSSFPYPVPSCPKVNNLNANCQSTFPDCDGKNTDCPQKLRLTNKNGNPIIIDFFYYTDIQSRDGRIKKQNATLKMIILRYGLNEDELDDL